MTKFYRHPLLLVLAATVPVTLACLGGSRFSDERDVCDAYLDCVATELPEQFPAISAAYGDDSACWESRENAEQCASACLAASELIQGCVIDDGSGDPPIDPVGAWTASRIRFDDAAGEDEAALPGVVPLGDGFAFDGAILLTLAAGGSGTLVQVGELIEDGVVIDGLDISAPSTWTILNARSFMLDVTEAHILDAGELTCASENQDHTSILCAKGASGVDYAEIRFTR